MKPLRISQKQYYMYQANGLWFYLLAIRQIIVPLLMLLYIYPLLAWHSQELLIGGLVYYVVMAALFFLRKKAFVILYIAQAAVVIAFVISLLYANPSGANLRLLELFVLLDIGFISFLFTSRQAAVAFKTRKLEITDQESVIEETVSYSRIFRAKNRLISGGVLIAVVALVMVFRTAVPTPLPKTTGVDEDYIQAQMQIMEQINNQSHSPLPVTARPSASGSFAPQKSAMPSPSAMYNPKYDVLRRGAAAPAKGSYDPLKLTYGPTCLGEDIKVVLYNLEPADYTNQGYYEFYPKFDYLGLGWETNQVQLGVNNGKVISLTYITQSLNVTKPVDFLYAAETMHDQLVKIYGKPSESNYIEPDKGKTSPMDIEPMLQAMKKGERGICSFKWDLTGLRIDLSFTNQYQGPKQGHYELTFESIQK